MTFEKVRDMIVETLSCDAQAVTMEARLTEDLEADSLAAVELSMALEEEFGLTQEDGAMEQMKTVGDVVRYVDAHAA